MKNMTPLHFENLKELLLMVEALLDSADSAGCDGLVVVDKDAYELLLDFFVNYCGEDDLPEVWE